MATNPLLMALVPNAKLPKKALAPGRLDFIGAMKKLEKESVFDIVRGAKSSFIRQVAEYSDADAALAYDNAMCYAVQIVRAFREQQISSGKIQTVTRGSGIRSLVEVGPSYPNLFKENWDDFCKPGAIEALDSPPAYLSSLYRYAKEHIEMDSTDNKKILIDQRRPDLKELVIDQQTTFTQLPMLNIVNQVLSAGIEAYHKDDEGDTKTLYERLMEKRHPFMFPYHFYHHQVNVGLSDKNKQLGQLNYGVAPGVGFHKTRDNLPRAVNFGLQLLTGLSPAQITLLVSPPVFSNFYIHGSQVTADKKTTWRSPDTTSFIAHRDIRFGYVLPNQTSITLTDPDATSVISPVSKLTKVSLQLTTPAGETITRVFSFSAIQDGYGEIRTVNSLNGGGVFTKSLVILYLPADNADAPPPIGSSTSFYTIATASSSLDLSNNPQRSVLKRTFTLVFDDTPFAHYTLSEEQQAFFKSHYGVSVFDNAENPLIRLNTFMGQTELEADQVEALLALRRHAPVLSPNYYSLNILRDGNTLITPFPYPSHYGACYVNGVGAHESGAEAFRSADNSIGLFKKEIGVEGPDTPVLSWVLTNTSLDRFDRLQRMIRLQRWMNIPFNELDTLIVCAIRAEGDENLGMELNTNTLRTLGAYRYLSARYPLKPQEFAACLHHVTPYSTGNQKSLFDQVFNNTVLFDVPLRLDQVAFSLNDPDDEASRKTIAQLCSGLKLQPTETSFYRVANQTIQHVGPLFRTLTTVSSLYRQSRMAQLFGLTVEEASELVHLLGGDDYTTCWVKGTLTPHDNEADFTTDLLDVLMEMDWLVSWLNETGQTAQAFLQQLGLDTVNAQASHLQMEALKQLLVDAKQSVVTAEQLQKLNLPSLVADSPPINWLSELQKGLIDSKGLLITLPITLADDTVSQLNAAVTDLVNALAPDNPDTFLDPTHTVVIEKLTHFLAVAYTRQSRLVEGWLLETAQLPMNFATALTQWVKFTVHDILAVEIAPTLPVEVLEKLNTLYRHIKVVQDLNISERALRTFLVNPEWFDGDTSLDLSVRTLYLLDRYSLLMHTLGKPEDLLLSYFAQINTQTDAPKAALIADLLNWRVDQVQSLLALTPVLRVNSLAELEWLYRAQQACHTTGLAADALWLIANLTPSSETDLWKTAGEALMAAQTTSHSE